MRAWCVTAVVRNVDRVALTAFLDRPPTREVWLQRRRHAGRVSCYDHADHGTNLFSFPAVCRVIPGLNMLIDMHSRVKTTSIMGGSVV